MHKPIAITCGDPAGIAPEITVKAWEIIRGDFPVVWIGAPGHLPNGLDINLVDNTVGMVDPDRFNVLPLENTPKAIPGRPDAALAPCAVESINRAVELAQSGSVAGICTGPINKKLLQDGAGFSHPGHTEYLAELAGVQRVVMMLACPDLRVVPLTIHDAIKDVPTLITPDAITQTVEILDQSLRDQFGIPAPRIAVAGLNPHAGEGGKMGREEIEIITPTLDQLRARGFDLRGPLSADTMFHAGARAGYDVALCMYHDQALIPIKTLDFSGGVNVTLGLPFVRTSPDHGTAFDIAGQGIADPTSMVAALRMAHELGNRHAN